MVGQAPVAQSGGMSFARVLPCSLVVIALLLAGCSASDGGDDASGDGPSDPTSEPAATGNRPTIR